MKILSIRTCMAFLAASLVAATFSVANAGGTGSGVPTPARGGSDDVESVPIVASGETSPSAGFILQGNWSEVRQVVLAIQGSPSLTLQPTTSGQVVLTVSGDFVLQLDRHELAKGGVQLRALGFRDALHVLQNRRTVTLISRSR